MLPSHANNNGRIKAEWMDIWIMTICLAAGWLVAWMLSSTRPLTLCNDVFLFSLLCESHTIHTTHHTQKRCHSHFASGQCRHNRTTNRLYSVQNARYFRFRNNDVLEWCDGNGLTLCVSSAMAKQECEYFMCGCEWQEMCNPCSHCVSIQSWKLLVAFDAVHVCSNDRIHGSQLFSIFFRIAHIVRSMWPPYLLSSSTNCWCAAADWWCSLWSAPERLWPPNRVPRMSSRRRPRR